MMKPSNVILALAAVTAALLPIAARATEYADNPNPACHVMRNLMPGVAAPAEPNRADMLTVTQNDQFHNFRKSYFFLQKIDREGTAPLAQLPPSTPKIDMVIDMHLRNLVVARSELGDFAEDGRLGAGTLNPSLAVAMYQKAEETTFTDDRGCVHTWLPSFDTRVKLAGMYIYAIGTEQDAGKAKAALMSVDSSTIPIIKAIDQNWLPVNYYEFLRLAKTGMKEPPPSPEQILRAEREKALLSFFHMEPQPTPIWIVVLLIAAVASIVIVIVLAIVREVRDKIRVSGPPRNFFEIADLAQSAFARLDLFIKGLIITFGALSSFYGFYVGNLVTNYLSGWFDYLFIGLMVVIVAQGVFSIIGAMRGHTVAPNTQAHGSARPASEPEARAAAIGNARINDLHDRTFTD